MDNSNFIHTRIEEEFNSIKQYVDDIIYFKSLDTNESVEKAIQGSYNMIMNCCTIIGLFKAEEFMNKRYDSQISN